jgi:hypothetical protein
MQLGTDARGLQALSASNIPMKARHAPNLIIFALPMLNLDDAPS